MPYKLYHQNIVDREIETDNIAKLINDQTDKNHVLFLWAETGVGKSTVIRKALEKTKTSRRIIWVETPPINKNELVSQSQYLSYVASELDNSLAQSGNSLYDFLRKGSSKRVSREEWQNAVNGLAAGTPFVAINVLANRFLKTGAMDSDLILTGSSDESVLVMREYINYLFSRERMILVITNFQNIDTTSVEFLLDISQKTKGNFFVFEYTVENEETTKMWQHYERFRLAENVAAQEINVPNLPTQYAKKLTSNVFAETPDFDNFFQKTISGNIYKLEEKARQFHSGLIKDIDTDPLADLENLPFALGIILQLICIQDGNVSKEKLQYILFNSNFPDIAASLDQDLLELEQYVFCENNIVELKHSSIGDYALNPHSKNIAHAALIAYEILRDVLNQDLQKQQFVHYSKKEIVLLLLSLYTRFDPSKITNLYDNFRDILVNELSQDQALLLVDILLSSLQDKGSLFERDQLFGLVKMCYSIGLYKKAYTLLLSCLRKDDNYLIYEISLLNRLDRHEDVVNICNSLLTRRGNSVRFELIVKLVLLLSQKSLNLVNQYTETYFQLMKNESYKQYIEFGFVLRNAEVVCDNQTSAMRAQESISFFEQYGAKYQADTARLTLAIRLSYIGDFQKANKLLDDIEQSISNRTIEKHIIYNDRAAIMLLQRQTSDEILLLLEKALLTSHNTYDTLTIISNKLCWYIQNRRKIPVLENLIPQIDDYAKNEPDKRLKKRIYINLSQYYEYVEMNLKLRDTYFNMASNIDVDDALSNYFVTGDGKDSLGYLTELPYYVSFISYWHFDLPNL